MGTLPGWVRVARVFAAMVGAMVVTACNDNPSDDGPLEMHSTGQIICFAGETEILIGLSRVTNNDDNTIVANGVELIGEGQWTLEEAAILPYEYVANGRTWYREGGMTIDHRSPKWVEVREPIPGAKIEPGETMDFAYHATVSTGTLIDHAELTYEDDSGDEYFAADAVTIAVDEPGEGCTAD